MFTLDQVVPWGRSFDEYRAMFSLTDADLDGRILGCGDGPASFNATASRLGKRVVACDPIYHFSAADIRRRVEETCEQVLAQTRQNQHEFVWTSIPSVEELGRVRMQAMDAFLADYPAGVTEGRYIAAELPTLPFADGEFDLALCSHFLFLYSAQLGDAFHRDAVRELARVAREVRVFPLLALGGAPSPFVEGCVATLREAGVDAIVERVDYEFQRGGNHMLRCRRRAD
ncbi:MAG: methyltransferase domain-containing protein [Vicinamibacterales bacterium]